jgi:gliding motility-associated lipoprotein GldB
MKFFLRFFIIFTTFLSCTNDKIKEVDLTNIDIELKVERFDEAFYTASEKNLHQLKSRFPILFPDNVSDSIWLSKIKDTDEQELFFETQKIYKDFKAQELLLENLFKHIKYYNTNFKSPTIFTLLSNIDYDSRVIYRDSLLLISLDVYLGKNHEFYKDYPQYIKQNNTKEHLIVDVASAIIDRQFIAKTDRVFSSKIINEGKKMYLLDLYLPSISEKEKSGYSLEKLHWAHANEEEVWTYFIANELLYSTNTKLNARFVDNAPFSKFYMAEDNRSPGKIGVWIGWQIVKSYMKHNDVSLQKLITVDAQSLLNKSKYKPKK